MTVWFLHGLESGPHGSKYQALAAEFDTVVAPDFEGDFDIESRYTKVEELTRGMTGLILVGSSFGGLLAALLADRCPERVAGYVLMAPALHDKWPQAVEISRVPEKAVIVHGALDDVVPLQASRDFAARFDVSLVVVPDDHMLSHHRSLMVTLVKGLQLGLMTGALKMLSEAE